MKIGSELTFMMGHLYFLGTNMYFLLVTYRGNSIDTIHNKRIYASKIEGLMLEEEYS